MATVRRAGSCVRGWGAQHGRGCRRGSFRVRLGLDRGGPLRCLDPLVVDRVPVARRIPAHRRRASGCTGSYGRPAAAAVPLPVAHAAAHHETALDGTYIRTLTLRDVGGARIGLRSDACGAPVPDRRGCGTIMFWQGAYFLHHQMSGFRTQGSFVVDGDRVTCSTIRTARRAGAVCVRDDRARPPVRRDPRRLSVERGARR